MVTGLVPSLLSIAVTVQVPAVMLVIAKAFVPDTKAALAGSMSFGSVELMPIISVTVFTRFQLASTALTVRL